MTTKFKDIPLVSDPNVPAGVVMGINPAKFSFWRGVRVDNPHYAETPGDALVDAVSAIRKQHGLPVRRRRVNALDFAVNEYIKRNGIE